MTIRFNAGFSGDGGSVENVCEVIGSGYVFGCGWLAWQCIRGMGFTAGCSSVW